MWPASSVTSTDFLLWPASNSRWWCWPSRLSTELHRLPPNPGQTSGPSWSTLLFYISGPAGTAIAESKQSCSEKSRLFTVRLICSDFTSTQSMTRSQKEKKLYSLVCSYRCSSITALMHLKNLWQTAVMILRWQSDSCFYTSFCSINGNVVFLSCDKCTFCKWLWTKVSANCKCGTVGKVGVPCSEAVSSLWWRWVRIPPPSCFLSHLQLFCQ